MHNSRLMEELIKLIGWNAGSAENLLVEHRCSEHGKCMSCTDRGVPMAWPCTPYRAAEQARYLQELRTVRATG